MSMTIQQLVERSKVPSADFGKLVPKIDHKALGQQLLVYRRKKKVMAVQVADLLKISKVTLCFLEQGKRNWDLKKLKKYVRAVNRIYYTNKTFKG